MPRRKPKKPKRVKSKFFILCEGAKTEPQYFQRMVEEWSFEGYQIDVEIVDTKKNTAVELVREGIKKREFKKDQIWVVVDKDGYTKHAEAFKQAKDNNIKIAFSSISFETWVLLHFEKTSKSFLKAKKLISYINKKYKIGYEKNDCENYDKLKKYLKIAKRNAKTLRKYQKSGQVQPEYKWNPYTKIDLLISALETFIKKSRK
ncbi:RloB domain-containing protein [bacterium]|nr:RloB domain-containing protein [bacterium]